MKLFENEGCQSRCFAGRVPSHFIGAFQWCKGNSSSTNKQTATNQQVAVDGSGTAYGAVSASGAGATAASGGSSAISNQIKAGTNSKIVVNNTSSDPSVVMAALQSNTIVASNAIAANTEVNEDASAHLEVAEQNIATLSSQVISAFSGRSPQTAAGLTVAGDTGSIAASASGDAGSNTPLDKETDYIIIGASIVGLLLSAVVFYHSKGKSA